MTDDDGQPFERRRTVHYWPKRTRDPRGFFGPMFVEDVSLRVAPVGGRVIGVERPDFAVRVSPDDEASAKRVMRAIAPGDHRHRFDLTETVCEFVRARAQVLAAFGEERFEVLPVRQGGIALLSLARLRTYRIGPFLLQAAPPDVARQQARARLVALWPKEHWALRLPPGLGPAWRHRRMLRRLELRATSPLWVLNAMEARRGTAFEQKAFEEKVNVRVLARTRRWAWPARESGADQQTYYAQLRRRLLFTLTLAHLREHIVTELNHLFARHDVGAAIEFQGIPGSADVRDALRTLESGEKSFVEISRLVRW